MVNILIFLAILYLGPGIFFSLLLFFSVGDDLKTGRPLVQEAREFS